MAAPLHSLPPLARFARRPAARLHSAAGCRRVAAQRSVAAAAAPLDSEDAEDVAFMVANFSPWVVDEDGARRCLAFLRAKERRVFCRTKAAVVLAGLREDWVARMPDGYPFELPRTWPGMQLVLQRMSTPLD